MSTNATMERPSTVKLWDIRQLAEATGLSVHTIYAWTGQRRIPHVKIGTRVLFDPEEIKAWIEQNKVKTRDW
jgi:excisionase family DNA binding protein